MPPSRLRPRSSRETTGACTRGSAPRTAAARTGAGAATRWRCPPSCGSRWTEDAKAGLPAVRPRAPLRPGLGGGEASPAAHGLDHPARPEAARAREQGAHHSAAQGANPLEVRVPDPLAQVVSVAHVVPRHGSLAADLASLSQAPPPGLEKALRPASATVWGPEKDVGHYQRRRRL